jgi:hypothetical protein
LEHRGQAAANAALVELHVLVGPESRKDFLSLLILQAPEVKLIVVS